MCGAHSSEYGYRTNREVLEVRKGYASSGPCELKGKFADADNRTSSAIAELCDQQAGFAERSFQKIVLQR
jgi:hypothetical protein